MKSSFPNLDVSIIIPNWNGDEIIADCLESIVLQTRDVAFEILVVDNGSTDDSPRKIRRIAEKDSRVRPLFNNENRLFAKACNQGYDISDARFVLIANNDILLRDDAVSSLVRYADEHPQVGVVTPRFVDRGGRSQEFVRRLPNALHVLAHYHPLGRGIDRALLRRRLQNSYFYRDRSFQDVEEIEQAGASFSLFRKDMLERVEGLFDERFPLLFNDVDLYRRIKTAGFPSHVVPSIQVIHLEGVSSRKFDAAKFKRLQYRGMFEYFKKHHPLQYPLLCVAWPHWWIRNRRSLNAAVGKY